MCRIDARSHAQVDLATHLDADGLALRLPAHVRGRAVEITLVVQQAAPLVAAGQGPPPVVLLLARQCQWIPRSNWGFRRCHDAASRNQGHGTMADAEVTNPNAISSSIAGSLA